MTNESLKQFADLMADARKVRVRAEQDYEAAHRAWVKARDVHQAQQGKYRDALVANVRGFIAAWIYEQLRSKPLADAQAFLNRLGRLAIPYGYNVACEREREDELRRIAEGAFGEHIDAFCAHELSASATECATSYGPSAASLFARHLGAVLQTEYYAVSPVWRKDPQNPRYGWEVESRMRQPLYKDAPRYLLPWVFEAVRDAGRIKPNGEVWKKVSGCAWSFRNQATVDADIAAAVARLTGADLPKAA